MSRANLHIYPSCFIHESRILKETKSLANARLFSRIFIGAIYCDGLKEHEKLDGIRELWRVPIRMNGGREGSLWKVFKIIEWSIRIFHRYRKERIEVIHCHGLATLPVGVLFRWFVGSKLVYDAHELETEREGMTSFRRHLSKAAERFLMHRVDRLVVVSDSIAEWYKIRYSTREVHVIKNIPYPAKHGVERSRILKEMFGLEEDEILFIYQGVLDSGRGIEILLDVFSTIDSKRHIVFMGFGALEQKVQEYSGRFQKIHFQPAVPPEEVQRYTRSADVGISLIENTCLSYYYSLPNKLFEYILCGLPLIVSDFPDMGKIIDEYDCGWKVPVEREAVLKAVEGITKEDLKKKSRNIDRCRSSFSWKSEEEKLLQLYRLLMES